MLAVEPVSDEEWEATVARLRARSEAIAAKTAHRRVPMPPQRRGHCRWCARPIVGKRGKYIGRPDPNRSWCRTKTEGRDCWYDYCLHSRAETQFYFLERTRGLRCADCGVVDPHRWKSLGPINYALPPFPRGDMEVREWLAAMEEHRRACLAEFPDWGKATQIEWASALEVDHVVPLWKVALKPIELRRPFFGPDFLQLLCDRCHKAKTAAEAADRAALRALARAGAAKP